VEHGGEEDETAGITEHTDPGKHVFRENIYLVARRQTR
jgi:hypothetical protein